MLLPALDARVSIISGENKGSVTPAAFNLDVTREASERDRQRFLADKDNRYVMLVKDEIIAVGVLFDNILEAIAVKPASQNHGFGSIFISFLVNKLIPRGAGKVQLWVDDGNEAKQLYEFLGFNQLALYHFYYHRYRPETRPIGPPPELD